MNRRNVLKLNLKSGASAYIGKDIAPSVIELSRDKNIRSISTVVGVDIPKLNGVRPKITMSEGYKFPDRPNIKAMHCVENVGVFIFNGADWIHV